ncbi:acetate--CoA ligase family protein [Dactylosporangium sp. NPDC050688]|uniref:acetate--CoA ligase family protein n=1 Tax=Dactylosporangium sp. NPDC050688 TaxID=3157217 RepID=UPI0033C27F94
MSAVAIVGASAGSFWTLWLTRNLRRFGYQGEIYGVNKRRSELSIPLVESLSDVPLPIDAVVVAVRASACPAVVEEAARLGVQDIAVVSNGFAETGDEAGIALEQQLHDLGKRYGVRVYGPNGIGFADFAKGLCVLGGPIPHGLRAGDVDVISQSGSLLLMMLEALSVEDCGVDLAISLGNGASIDFARAVELCLDRPTGDVICGYLENIAGFRDEQDVDRLGRVLDRAAAAGRRVAVVKLGRSATGLQVAAAHTAAIAGDQVAVSAFLNRHDVMVADDIDELARYVHLARRLKKARRGPGTGAAVIGGSGGTAGLVADIAGAAGLRLPGFDTETSDVLAAVAGPGSFITNPIDLTAMPKDRDAVERAYQAVYEDANVGVVLVPFSTSFPLGDGDGQDLHRVNLTMHARLAARTGVPAVIASVVTQEWTEWTRQFTQTHGDDVVLVRGIGATVRALAALYPATGAATTDAPPPSGTPQTPSGIELGDVLNIVAGRRILQELGIGVTNGAVVRNAEEAAAAADSLRRPIVAKAAVDGLAHKARYGLVKLGLTNAADVAEASTEILDILRNAQVPEDAIAGVLLEEMTWGQELFIGLRRAPIIGPMVVVGVGGYEPETRKEQITALTPLTGADHDAVRLFLHQRCHLTPKASEKVLAVLSTLITSFVGGELASRELIEINPLIVTPDDVLAADIVVD